MDMSENNIQNIIKPNWEEIDVVRASSEEFLSRKNLSQDTLHSISMVSGELVENAVKYGSFKNDDQRIVHSIDIRENTITVEVKNPLDDDSEEVLERLDHQIQWIRGYQNPFEAYVEKLKGISENDNDDDDESGLGLVRIAYEGQSILDFYVDENNILSISAVYRY